MGESTPEKKPPWFISVENGNPTIRWKPLVAWVSLIIGIQILANAVMKWFFPGRSHWSEVGLMSVIIASFLLFFVHFRYRRFSSEYLNVPSKQFRLPILFVATTLFALCLALARIDSHATTKYYRDRETLVEEATAIVEKGRVRFSGNQNLLMVVVNRFNFDDSDLAELLSLMQKRLKGRGGIYFLLMSDTAITDASAEKLAKCRYLQHLMLDGNSITDETLKHLVRIESLQSISMAKTQITQRGLDRFCQTRPEVKVSPIRIAKIKE